MSEPFRPYEKLVEITLMGKKFQVPERNSLLRCFQFISPETIPYGRFCWNQDCQYCRVTCQLPDDDEPREMLSCKFIVGGCRQPIICSETARRYGPAGQTAPVASLHPETCCNCMI